jgi:hypothetical protein
MAFPKEIVLAMVLIKSCAFAINPLAIPATRLSAEDGLQGASAAVRMIFPAARLLLGL